MRSIPEWIGKTDDSKIPGRVQTRLFDAANGRCQQCGVHLIPGHFAFDHITALANGGTHAEANLQVLCDICHGVKTKKDVMIKSARARKIKKCRGIDKKPSQFQNARTGPFKTKIGGRTERRET